MELAVVGRPGWKVDAVVGRLASHPELGARLHWLQAADDADLVAAYTDSDALIATSFGEGFGLPIVEAARHRLPVLARDLAVFREVAGEGADYFQALDGDALALVVQDWMDRRARGAVADPSRIERHDWRQCAAALAREMLRS